MALSGKTAVITGGASGIGLATAHHYLKDGVVNLVLLDISNNEENVQKLKDEFQQANIDLMLTDITKRDDVEQTFKRILERFQQIDIVVNCAGIFCEKNLERTINVNLIGLIHTSLVAMNAMSKVNGGKGGIIVNVASAAALTASPIGPFYSTSKCGVLGFTRSMAHDCFYSKHGVIFTVVCPSLTKTTLASDISVENILFPETVDYVRDFFAETPCQTADECGKNISIITASARNGAIWIIQCGRIEEVFMPKLYKRGQ